MQTLTAESRATFWRSLQTLNATRIAIALVLLLYLVFQGGARAGQLAYSELCLVYVLLAFAFALLTARWRHRFLPQLLAQLAVDVGFISLLYLDAGGVYSGLAILYLFPLAGAAILAPLLPALFCAAFVTLFMLAESTYQILNMDGASALAQAGLYGAAFFAAVLMLSRLAARLIGQEALAVQHGNALAIQQAINRLVIADMGDGIVVVDRDGQVFTCNPAARAACALARTSASASWQSARRSLCPTMTKPAPASASIAAEIHPVCAPEAALWQSWPPIRTLPLPATTAAPTSVDGGATHRSSRAAAIAAISQIDAASPFIFQLPTIRCVSMRFPVAPRRCVLWQAPAAVTTARFPRSGISVRELLTGSQSR